MWCINYLRGWWRVDNFWLTCLFHNNNLTLVAVMKAPMVMGFFDNYNSWCTRWNNRNDCNLRMVEMVPAMMGFFDNDHSGCMGSNYNLRLVTMVMVFPPFFSVMMPHDLQI